MDRRRFLLTSLAGALAAPLAAGAQQVARGVRIGYLRPGSLPLNRVDEALEQGLQEFGWVKGRNLHIEYGHAGGRQDAMPAVAATVIGTGVDIVVVWGPALARAVRSAAPHIPLVFLSAVDPVDAGLISSYARPGGNMTGVTNVAGPEIFGKRLQILKEASPSLNRVLVLSSSEATRTTNARDALVTTANSLKVRLDDVVIDSATAAESAIRNAKSPGTGIYVWPGGLVYNVAENIAQAARASRLPSIHPFREGAFAGCLLSYAVDLADVARRGAVYIDKVLRGAHPGGIPVENLSKYDLIINLKTAKALGLTIPPSLLARADQVIE